MVGVMLELLLLLLQNIEPHNTTMNVGAVHEFMFSAPMNSMNAH
jgi:hypothetical protein